jgi:arsenite methyltransferase
MFPIAQVLWHEATASSQPSRKNEPCEIMNNLAQVRSYAQAYAWGGAMSVVQLHHISELSVMIRPGDTILDLACGPGALLLELAAIYPECKFIGADLSPLMLQHLEQETRTRELKNVSVLHEDIQSLPSLRDREVDLIISTIALHHLPDEVSLRRVLQRIKSLLTPGGGFYIFDFALLKSPKTRRIIVEEAEKLAPPITTQDYDMSLQAAFPLDVACRLAKEELPRPFLTSSCAFADFFVSFKTPDSTKRSSRAQEAIDHIWKKLPLSLKFEYLMLRGLRRHTNIAA